MANQQTIIGLDTPGCSWDPLFSAYYAQHRQEILPGEVDFWRSHCRPGDRVLEVGAGTGFIARAYAPLPRLELTLIEPEATNVAYLKRISTNPTTTLEIFPGIFQHFKQPQPFDLVVSSWDNLVMFTDDKGKDGFFSFAARSLRPAVNRTSSPVTSNCVPLAFTRFRTSNRLSPGVNLGRSRGRTS